MKPTNIRFALEKKGEAEKQNGKEGKHEVGEEMETEPEEKVEIKLVNDQFNIRAVDVPLIKKITLQEFPFQWYNSI